MTIVDFGSDETALLPLPNQKSKINKRSSSIIHRGGSLRLFGILLLQFKGEDPTARA